MQANDTKMTSVQKQTKKTIMRERWKKSRFHTICKTSVFSYCTVIEGRLKSKTIIPYLSYDKTEPLLLYQLIWCGCQQKDLLHPIRNDIITKIGLFNKWFCRQIFIKCLYLPQTFFLITYATDSEDVFFSVFYLCCNSVYIVYVVKQKCTT